MTGDSFGVGLDLAARLSLVDTSLLLEELVIIRDHIGDRDEFFIDTL